MDVGSVYGSYYETAKSYMGLRKEENKRDLRKRSQTKVRFPRKI